MSNDGLYNMKGAEAAKHITKSQFKTIGKHDTNRVYFSNYYGDGVPTYGIEHRDSLVNNIHVDNNKYHAQYSIHRNGKYYGHSLWKKEIHPERGLVYHHIKTHHLQDEEVTSYKFGTIPNPIPKKFLKKASGQQDLTKEDAAVGFADASAPSNSNYQTELSPTQMAKKPSGKKKKMKTVKEHYEKNIVEAKKVQTLRVSMNKSGIKLHDDNSTVFHVYSGSGEPSRKSYIERLKYNGIHAEPAHSYYVGHNAIRVHNKHKDKAEKIIFPHHFRESTNKVCPDCNNTGVVRKFGNNVLCSTCGGDARSANPEIIGKQARDMLATGQTVAVKESKGLRKYSLFRSGYLNKVLQKNRDYGEFLNKRIEHNKGHKFKKDCPDCREAKRLGRNPETYRFNEQVITSFDEVESILEAYKASPSLLSRTKHLVQPKLSKTLRDRLAARKPKSKGYKASQGTLGLAAARRAQMSHAKEKSPKGYPEEVKSLAHKEVADDMAHKKAPVKESVNEMDGGRKYNGMGSDHDAGEHRKGPDIHIRKMLTPKAVVKSVLDKWIENSKKLKTGPKGMKTTSTVDGVTTVKTNEDFGQGNFSSMTRDFPLKSEAKSKKPNYSARVQGKPLPALSMKPQMGSSNDNRMSEEILDESWGEKTQSFKHFKDIAQRWADHNTHDGKARLQHKAVHSGNSHWHQTTSIGYSHKDHRDYIIGVFNHTHGPHSEQGGGQHSSPYHFDEQYSKDAVDKEIKKDKRIGNREAKRIHALLKGRTHTPDRNANPPITKAEIMKRNGVKEELLLNNSELKKVAGDSKANLKRKYLGIKRGRTATGKPAHAIEIDPVIRTDTNLNKIVK
jgi:diadenosine tetraphosphatase ApaH/serine/threonine PP2A family protein phosphatase